MIVLQNYNRSCNNHCGFQTNDCAIQTMPAAGAANCLPVIVQCKQQGIKKPPCIPTKRHCKLKKMIDYILRQAFNSQEVWHVCQRRAILPPDRACLAPLSFSYSLSSSIGQS
jgi:hypothetical protein